MELYILGPAFSLPSIDAECIAAVALLQLLDRKDWSLVPTHDDRGGLPLLVDQGQRISGYKNILRHLEIELHVGNAIAISSFLERGAQTLLDISLYVSFESYSTTRSAFTQILPWHTNYLLPPRRRAAARARTDHLGISSIDVDNVHEDLSGRPSGMDGVGKEQAFEVEAQKRASLLLPRKDTLRSLLQKPEHSAVFKLHALADNFFGPLQDMLDCLAFGYLSLMLYPKLPQDWLASTMRRKYAKLVAYVERMNDKLVLRTDVKAVMSSARSDSESILPWKSPASSSFFDVANSTARELFTHIPLLKPTTSIITTNADTMRFWQHQLPAILTLTVLSLGLGITAAFRTGTLTWPKGEALHVFGRKRFSDYGHLGAALAGMSVLSQQTTSPGEPYMNQGDSDKAVLADVEVEVNVSDTR
ncbi:hypothetical protein LTR97_007658 [Elasticomyces elasticus]|uniref:Mitochondrial outer membrane transport complex Sam37/metaxin N-terminal domain-containing protein n=1 Tax=Elasticomyces elasticus TaxID=574655 RepID=A0AAN7WEZ4_9PEZI|nr:hypothetical protein LTR97_007658 [Elasticomyces elasticus]